MFSPLESPETRREDRYGRALVAAIIGITLLVGLLDFWTSPDLVGSILFTIPLALCARQRSNRLLWGTTAVAVFLTIAAEVWGFSRSALPDFWDASVNRGLLFANLLTLATFIQLWIRNKQQLTIPTGRYGGDSQHQRAQGCRRASGADGGPVSGADAFGNVLANLSAAVKQRAPW